VAGKGGVRSGMRQVIAEQCTILSLGDGKYNGKRAMSLARTIPELTKQTSPHGGARAGLPHFLIPTILDSERRPKPEGDGRIIRLRFKLKPLSIRRQHPSVVWEDMT
jgi:hypothetical protein